MARQYVAVAYKQGGRPYTYHNDGEPVAIGDLVRVSTRFGEQKATVVSIEDERGAPPFETKAILEKLEDGGLLNSIGENEHGTD